MLAAVALAIATAAALAACGDSDADSSEPSATSIDVRCGEASLDKSQVSVRPGWQVGTTFPLTASYEREGGRGDWQATREGELTVAEVNGQEAELEVTIEDGVPLISMVDPAEFTRFLEQEAPGLDTTYTARVGTSAGGEPRKLENRPELGALAEKLLGPPPGGAGGRQTQPLIDYTVGRLVEPAILLMAPYGLELEEGMPARGRSRFSGLPVEETVTLTSLQGEGGCVELTAVSAADPGATKEATEGAASALGQSLDAGEDLEATATTTVLYDRSAKLVRKVGRVVEVRDTNGETTTRDRKRLVIGAGVSP